MNLDDFKLTGSHFGFSASRISDLGAAEYTLVTIAADSSPSVEPFRHEIERCIQTIVKACRQSPRADNLMLRVTAFESTVSELHGFKPLTECPLATYDGCLPRGGGTALHDAAENGVRALVGYGKHLTDADLCVNGILFVITDGADNSSRAKVADVANALATARRNESLESLTTVLVGVNVRDASTGRELAALHREAGFSHYLELEAADADTLARLAEFVCRSVYATSLSLGTGVAPSVKLVF